MSSYKIISLLPLWLIVPAALGAFAYTWWAYRVTVPPLSAGRKGVLVALRTAALTLIALLLLAPSLQILKVELQKPELLVVFDNSESMTMDDAGGSRKDQLATALKAISESDLGLPQSVHFAESAETIQKDSLGTLAFRGQQSNINAGLRHAQQLMKKRNVRGVLLVTDGAFNAGDNPTWTADMLGVPVYTVGVGDSTEPRDVAVRSILVNEIVYLQSTVPVNATVRAKGLPEGTTKASLFVDGKEVQSKELSLSADRLDYELQFEWKPSEAGLKKVEVRLGAVEGELTAANNSASDIVRVLETKRSVSIIAGSAQPDITFMRSTLREIPDLNVATYIHDRNGSFIEGALNPNDLAKSELLILIDFPTSVTPRGLIDQIKRLAENGKPLFFVAGPKTDWNKVKMLEPVLPFSVISSSPQETQVMLDVSAQALASPVLKLTGTDADRGKWNSLPPIFRQEVFVKAKPEAEVLANVRINNTPLSEPLILQRTLQNSRSLAVVGYGIWRWKLVGYAAEVAKGREAVDAFTPLVNNAVRWLTTEEQGKLVRVRPTRRQWALGEEVQIIGQVYDASYEPISDAEISVTLQGPDSRELRLTPLGGGRYSTSVAGLPEGDYGIKASATWRGAVHGTDEARFTVGGSSVELRVAQMNAPLLRDIAQRTEGNFVVANNIVELLKNIPKDKRFTEKQVRSTEEKLLWTWGALLAAIVALFSLEWFLRKRGGMS